MQSQNWITRALAAGTAGDVLDVSNGYLGTWQEGQLMHLPVGCLPPPLAEPKDVTRYAFALAIATLRPPAVTASASALESMSTFFSYAATRVSQLQRRPANAVR